VTMAPLGACIKSTRRHHSFIRFGAWLMYMCVRVYVWVERKEGGGEEWRSPHRGRCFRGRGEALEVGAAAVLGVGIAACFPLLPTPAMSKGRSSLACVQKEMSL
jgi:hypothetical protein